MSHPAAPIDAGGSARCFLALLPDATGQAALRHCREAFDRPHAGAPGSVRWSAVASMHLTLRFFGETPGTGIEHLKQALPSLARPLPVIDAHRFAIWPNRTRPRLLVLELDAPDALRMLTRACEVLARECGFEPEPRAFKAHVTLARLRRGCAFAQLSAPPPSLIFGSLALMRSTLARPAPRYTPLASIPIPPA